MHKNVGSIAANAEESSKCSTSKNSKRESFMSGSSRIPSTGKSVTPREIKSRLKKRTGVLARERIFAKHQDTLRLRADKAAEGEETPSSTLSEAGITNKITS